MSGPFRVLDYDFIQIQIQVERMTEQNIARHLAAESMRIQSHVDEARRTGKPGGAVLIVDGSVQLVPPPQVRRLQADWLRDNRDKLGDVMHAMGVVVPNNLVRGALTALTWLAPMPVPMTVHASLEHALDWAIATVDTIGGTIPQRLLLGGAELVEQDKVAG